MKPVIVAAKTVACQPTTSVMESSSALSLLNCGNCEGAMSPAHQCNSVSEEKEQPAPLPLCHYCCHLGSGDHPVHFEQRCLCSELKCICQCYCTEIQVEVKRQHFTQPTWNAGWKPLTSEERAQAHAFASDQNLKIYRGKSCTNNFCLDWWSSFCCCLSEQNCLPGCSLDTFCLRVLMVRCLSSFVYPSKTRCEINLIIIG